MIASSKDPGCHGSRCLNEDTAVYNEYLEHCSITACHVMYKIFCSSKGYSIVNLFYFPILFKAEHSKDTSVINYGALDNTLSFLCPGTISLMSTCECSYLTKQDEYFIL